MKTYQDFIAYLKKVRKSNDTKRACGKASPCEDVNEIECSSCPLHNSAEFSAEEVHATIDKYLEGVTK